MSRARGYERVCGGGHQGDGDEGGGDSWWLLRGLVWGLCPVVVGQRRSKGAAGVAGDGVKPVEKLVELICSFFNTLSCSSTIPLEVGYLPHPTPYVPAYVLLQFSPVVVLTLPNAMFYFSLNKLELCLVS